MACTIWDYEGEGMDGTLDDSGSERKGWVCRKVVFRVCPNMETGVGSLAPFTKWRRILPLMVQSSLGKVPLYNILDGTGEI